MSHEYHGVGTLVLVITKWHRQLAYGICYIFSLEMLQLKFVATNFCLSIAMDSLLLNAIQIFESM